MPESLLRDYYEETTHEDIYRGDMDKPINQKCTPSTPVPVTSHVSQHVICFSYAHLRSPLPIPFNRN